MSHYGIPGLSAAVGKAGELIWSGGFGFADFENFVPAKASTVFRIASISKPLTAVVAMQAWESGKLDLDVSVHRYISSFPEKPWPITVRQLLCHQGGIRHYRNDTEIFSTKHYSRLTDALELFAADPLVAEPGTKYSYTTYGYVLLGAAIEAAAGRSFTDLLEDRLLRPAEMKRTFADDVYRIIPDRARGYFRSKDGTLNNAGLADTSNKIPGGGLLSSASDLVRFAQAFRAGRLVRASTVHMMLTPQRTKTGEKTTYGLGFMLDQLDGRTVFGHTGHQPGASAILRSLEDGSWTVAILCNLENVPLSSLADSMLRLLRGEPRPGSGSSL